MRKNSVDTILFFAVVKNDVGIFRDNLNKVTNDLHTEDIRQRILHYIGLAIKNNSFGILDHIKVFWEDNLKHENFIWRLIGISLSEEYYNLDVFFRYVIYDPNRVFYTVSDYLGNDNFPKKDRLKVLNFLGHFVNSEHGASYGDEKIYIEAKREILGIKNEGDDHDHDYSY